jgi:cytochrome c oxidase subunit 1
MLNALAFVSMFVIGGLSGIFMAATPVDLFIHDTYFIVAHIHYVLFMSSMFGIFAAIYFWFPKMFGRLMNERWGKIHFVLTFIAANCTFYPMHILGVGGMPRRYYMPADFDTWASFQPINTFISMSAFVMGFSQLIFLGNIAYSLFWGPKAERNPWKSNSLEWTAPSPPGHGNFESPPIVMHGPYEYGVPGLESDYLPQTKALPDGVAVPAAH